ncbi:Ubiquitin-associated 1 [Senna tora]|uniref:Ubiquitin-associated 1 n=1 Tax=Senna tora TaxID=362788 RepID=A0A834T7Y1_9FABA|nr:Ubiquitin-associated 1 [Senna tora]
MDYDPRKRSGPPMYRPVASPSPSQPSSSPATHPVHVSATYPKIGQHGHAAVVPPVGRASPHHQTSTHSASSGSGIKVAVKQEYRITPPVRFALMVSVVTMLCFALQNLSVNTCYSTFNANSGAGMLSFLYSFSSFHGPPSDKNPRLSPTAGDIPRSNFQFDFELERQFLAEAEKESANWSRFGMENLPTKGSESTSQVAPVSNPIVSKYVAEGFSRESALIAVAHFGDNPTKVQEFIIGYSLMREMGFPSSPVADALIMHENNADKALAHILSGSSSQS